MAALLTTSLLTPANAIDVYRGLSFTARLTVTQDDLPYDLTGATLYFTVKCDVKSLQNALQKTSLPAGGIVIAADPRDGYADIALTTADTQALDPGKYVFDIVLVTVSGERFLITGPSTMRVLQGVMRF